MSREEIDWAGLRTAAVAVGIRQAARQAARDLPPDEQERFVQRAMKRCSREKWLVRAEHIMPSRVVRNVRSGAEALANTLAERKDQSALHLSRYVVDASHKLAKSRGDLDKAQAMRHVAAGRSHLWPEQQAGGAFTLNVLNLGSMGVEVRDKENP